VVGAQQNVPGLRQLAKARDALGAKIEGIASALQATSGGQGLSDGGKKLCQQLEVAKREMAVLEERRRQIAAHAQHGGQSLETGTASAGDVDELTSALGGLTVHQPDRTTEGPGEPCGNQQSRTIEGTEGVDVGHRNRTAEGAAVSGSDGAAVLAGKEGTRLVNIVHSHALPCKGTSNSSVSSVRPASASAPSKDMTWGANATALRSYLKQFSEAEKFSEASGLRSEGGCKLQGATSHPCPAASTSAQSATEVQLSSSDTMFVQRMLLKEKMKALKVCLPRRRFFHCVPSSQAVNELQPGI
jgi:hypothetical protein